ncbi:MAG: Hsp70 family protein [Alphaproteobacteria bacterium]|nr:Hsp70 family protein [Alphaproteobacteria bacterium]
MKNISAGIDFGTSNSAAAFGPGSAPELVALENAHTTIPTALYFENADGVLFGREAIACYMDAEPDAGRLMRSIKRILGTSLMNSGGTLVGKRLLKYDEIIGTFIRHIKEKIDAAAGEDIENVVLGRPVHFRDNDPAGDARAQAELHAIAINAGFKSVAFQLEPIAAAFAHERLLTGEKLAFVADIGGGTSDFTIIRLGPEYAQKLDRAADILANHGIRVGGNDFDKAFSLKSFMPQFGMETEIGLGKTLPIPTAPFFELSTWSQINDLYTYKSLNLIKKYLHQSRAPQRVERLLEIVERRLGHKNLARVEEAKIELSGAPQIKTVLEFLSGAPAITATREDFEIAIERDAQKLNEAIKECIRRAGVKASDINLVILTGGSTEIPYISQAMRAHFPDAELSAADKFSSVGLGLSFDAARRFN